MNEMSELYPVLKKGSYLCNAAIGAMHVQVATEAEKWLHFLRDNGASGDNQLFEHIESCREKISQYLGTNSTNIAFGANSSFNMNMFAGLLKKRSPKNKVIIPAVEFPTSFKPWEHQDFDIQKVANDGVIRISEIIESCDSQTAAVVVSGVQFFTGQRLDLIQLGQELKQRGIPFVVNATQMIGAFVLPIHEAHISLLTASGHKWLGAGLGLAMAYVHPDFLNSSFPFAGWTSVENLWELKNGGARLLQQASALELGTWSFCNIAQFSKALEVYQGLGPELVQRNILANGDYLEAGLNELGAEFVVPRTNQEKTGILTFKLPSISDYEKLVQQLNEKNIFVNTRRAALRVSVHHYNNKREMDLLLQHLRTL